MSIKRAFTLLEILIVLAIVAIVAAILFPIIASAQKTGQKASCLLNARQIGLAALQYSSDNDDHFGFDIMGSNIWLKRLGLTKQSKLLNVPKLSCPSIRFPANYSSEDASGYAYNGCTPYKLPANPSRTVMVGEVGVIYPIAHPEMLMSPDFLYFPDSYWVDMSPWVVDIYGSKYAPANEWAATRHQGHANYVFFDGSAKSYPPEAFRIPKSGYPCSRPVTEWIGPSSGPTFNPDGAS